MLPGVYREVSDPTNGLTISKSGIELIGLSMKMGKRTGRGVARKKR